MRFPLTQDRRLLNVGIVFLALCLPLLYFLRRYLWWKELRSVLKALTVTAGQMIPALNNILDKPYMKTNSLRLFRLQAFMTGKYVPTGIGMNTADFFPRGFSKITVWKNIRSFGRKWERTGNILSLYTDQIFTVFSKRYTVLIFWMNGKNSLILLLWTEWKLTNMNFLQKSTDTFQKENILSAV